MLQTTNDPTSDQRAASTCGPSEINPESSVEVAARITLRHRLGLVTKQLRKAAQRSSSRVQHVHKLRVNSRRALAALSIYEPLLPQRKVKWFRKQLKRTRSTAGDARDLDVLLIHYRNQQRQSRKVERWLLRRRKEAQRPINDLHHELITSGRLQRRMKKLLRSIAPADAAAQMALRQWAWPRLQDKLAACCDTLPKPDGDVASLHRFRIQIKSLRYTLETFAPLFSEDARQLIFPPLRRIQERLGDLNDHATALVLLKRFRRQADDARVKSELKKWIKQRRSDLQRSIEALDEHQLREIELDLNRLAGLLAIS